mmetsp:Transcript_105023/g.301944  ORF Transcript_105023/g.301944 Transcript_105023/m.301944 type:complete len:266 (+) Transcript_105023:82-879(+)
MILLDARIRDYVLLPIFLVVVLTQALRSNFMAILKSDTKVDLKEVKTQNMLSRCRALRAMGHMLPLKAFSARKAYFVKKDQGVLVKNPPKAKDPMEALSGGGDPMAAMGHMKGQVMYMLSQGILAYWVSFLFSGFLVAKTPFPLTFQFKSMTQRGVEVQALEPGYVSSLCWYMFVLMSSHSVLSIVQQLFFNTQVDDDDNPMMAMMGSMGGGGMMPGGGPDMSKIYKQEQESLEMIQHEFLLGNPGASDGIEVELWRKWRADRHK